MRKLFSKINTSQNVIISMLLYVLVPLLLLVAGLLWFSNQSPAIGSNSGIHALACSQANHLDAQVDINENLQFQIRNNPSWINLLISDEVKTTEAAGSVNLILQQSAIFNDAGLAIFTADNIVKLFGNPDITVDPGWFEELNLISNQQENTRRTNGNWLYAAQLLPKEPQFEHLIAVVGLPIQLIKSYFDEKPIDYGYSIFDAKEKVVYHPSGNLIDQGYTGYILIISGIILLILIVTLTWVFYKNYLKPVKNIAQGLNSINQRNLDGLKPIDSSSKTGEISDLIHGYNGYLALVKSNDLKEKALRQSEERFGLAIRGANDGIWDWDLKENFCYYSPRWRYMLGYTEESVRNTPSEWFTRVHPDDIDELKADMNAHLEGNTPYFENEHRLRHMNGTYLWVLARGLALRDDNGKAYRFAGSVGDISKRKAYETQLIKDAMHDPLTNLPNKTFFKEALIHSLSRMHRREDYFAAVLLIDLDHFKSINEELGYSAGDGVLNEISIRLINSLRTIDTIARSNGDEFSILLEEINGLHDAIRVTQRIQKDIIKPINIGDRTFSISASIGIVIITRAYQDPDEILRDADTAAFQARANGHGRYEIFDKEMHAHSLSKLRLEEELQSSINNEQFRLFYQPVIKSGTGDIQYVEALLRWNHPEKGLINTENFIPLAEESGQINLLDKWVLKNACREARIWIENGFDQLRVSGKYFTKTTCKPGFPGNDSYSTCRCWNNKSYADH